MKPILLAVAAASLSLSALAASDAQASNYPPSYDACNRYDDVYNGPFEVVRDGVRDGHDKLTVAYRGYLRQSFPDNEINIYIRLNGNDAFLPASAGSNGDAYIYLDSGPRACVWCNNGTNYYSQCDGITFPLYSSGQWVCVDPSATEDHLFYWAYDQSNHVNAWDIEVAAESHGYWDSNWSSNYDFRLEPSGCW